MSEELSAWIRLVGHVRVMYVNVCYGPLMAFDDKDLSAEDFCI
jgi:hypothetical protein